MSAHDYDDAPGWPAQSTPVHAGDVDTTAPEWRLRNDAARRERRREQCRRAHRKWLASNRELAREATRRWRGG